MARATTRTSADPDLATLQAQVAEIGDQLGSLLTRAKQDGGALAEAELSQLQARVQAMMADMKDRGHEALVKVEDTVKEHPGTSLLTAFAAGALLTGLLMRR
ncbi:DUF883 family protein [Ferrovibrio xuzhouensis]|uniref:YqjD family protein n=1 Tax=Ferrovibrio xuzhouensis TaxID=1576914 RepID=A0ABV7VIR3_9PROT